MQIDTPVIKDQIVETFVDLTQVASPGTPATGRTRMYAKSDGKVYVFPVGGIETEIGFLLSQSIADHFYSGIIAQFTAGENLVLGDLLCYKSDGKIWKANAVSSLTMPCFGLATETKSAEDLTTVLLKGYFKDESLYNWTTGGQANAAAGLIYVSEATAGLATQTRPSASTNIIQIVGFAHSADVIYFNPDNTFIELV